MFQHRINAESFHVSQLCVNTLPATKVTLITDGIKFGTLRVKSNTNNIAVLRRFVLALGYYRLQETKKN